MTISVCMIVKDEEKILPGCLDCLKAIADEIIIVDTGSSDGTADVAGRYTDKVYSYEWRDDFAAARNYAFSKATMDYIYSADADEIIDEENIKKFSILKRALLPEVDIVQMVYTNQLAFNTTYNFDRELRPKLYKRLREFVWEESLHERVRLAPVIFDSDIEIIHKPLNNHNSRDFSMYRRISARDGKMSARLNEMYARELFISGTELDFIKAADFFIQAIDADAPDITDDTVRADACVLTKYFRIMNDPEGVLKYSARAMAVEAPSELVFELGEYYRLRGDLQEAVMWYYNAAFETKSILNVEYSGRYPLMGLAVCSALCDNAEAAEHYIDMAVNNGSDTEDGAGGRDR